MAASAEQTAQLRRMVAELTPETYSDSALAAYLEAHPVRDRYGEPPYTTLGLDNASWVATYDMNAAAADVWEEKAAALACAYDVNADGADMKRSQLHKQASSMARTYRARSGVRSAPMLSRRDESERHCRRYGELYDDVDGAEILDGLAGEG